MEKNCKVVMLPTEKAEKGCIIDFTKYKEVCQTYSTREYLSSIGGKANHLYLISDDEIKKDDWYLCGRDSKPVYYDKWQREPLSGYKNKKIIASTDPDLGITDHQISPVPNFVDFPQIPESFIKAYVEANGIDEVEVEYEEVYIEPEGIHSNRGVFVERLKLTDNNEVIITHIGGVDPVEEKPWTQSEIYMALQKKVTVKNPMDNASMIYVDTAGAELYRDTGWGDNLRRIYPDGKVEYLNIPKGEKMYSREEVVELLKPLYFKAYHEGHEENCATIIANSAFDKWIEENL